MRYLIFGGPGIGDTIIELSLAKGIKENDKNAIVDLIISSNLGSDKIINEILLCQNYIDNFYSWSKKDIKKLIKVFFELKANHYSYSFSCCTSFKANKNPVIVSKLIGCKSVVKYIPKKTGDPDIPIIIQEDINEVLQYQKILNALYPEARLDLNVLDFTKIPSSPIYGKYIVLVLGTNITIYWNKGKKIEKNIKEWDIKNWICLANALAKEKVKVVLVGGKKEEKSVSDCGFSLKKNIHNFCGKTDIIESLSIIKNSDLVIGADTGMMHCAAALDKKTISLFGGTDFKVWRPYSKKNEVIVSNVACSPCYGLTRGMECGERKCMNKIDVDYVIKKINEVISI